MDECAPKDNSSFKSTQCNLYLLAKTNLKNKSVACNISKKQRTTSTLCNLIDKPLIPVRTKSIQCYLQLPVPKKVSKSTQCVEKPWIPVIKKVSKSTQYAEKLSMPVVKNVSKTTQCNEYPMIFKQESTNQHHFQPLILKSSFKNASTQAGFGLRNTYFTDVTRFIDLHFPHELFYEVKEDCNGHLNLFVTRKKGFGLFAAHADPLTLTIKEDGSCILNIIFKDQETFSILSEDATLNMIVTKDLLLKLSGRLGHVFCSGVNPSKLEDSTGFTIPRSLVRINFPCLRLQSNRCEVFYQSRAQVEGPIMKVQLLQCKHCSNLTEGIRKSKIRKAQETPSIKLKRLRVTSNYPIRLLTPRHQKIRIDRIQKSRHFLISKLAKLEKEIQIRDRDLNHPHSQEMS